MKRVYRYRIERDSGTGTGTGTPGTGSGTYSVFSFKLRGAMMAKLSNEQLAQGVICSSAGNHAQGVALAAKTLGCDVVIVMPITTHCWETYSPSVSQGTTSKAVVQPDLTNLPEKSRKQSYIYDRKDCWNLVSMELDI
ncbi:threonine dehydratase biosynthetic, chloroplastic-like protein [Tanacetum coccineum]|uniref:Threonine dehydratase biosynthetic, chloroplastic-like protein n=1 Tax=Tanacetum coccineum TaxID=301880 RepID=A0ABQ4WPT7_9ASTR